jgi:hypothetical protein
MVWIWIVLNPPGLDAPFCRPKTGMDRPAKTNLGFMSYRNLYMEKSTVTCSKVDIHEDSSSKADG